LSVPHVYRCAPAARWLPRILAASVFVGATILSTRIYAGVAGSGWSHSRTLVVLFGAAFALGIVRSGGMVHAKFSLSADALRLGVGKHERELPFEQIVSMTYESPFVKPREWLPALVLVDRFDKRWRVPALLMDGERFVEDLTNAADRDDLRSFVTAHNLCARMERLRWRLVCGYTVALVLIVVPAVLSLTGTVAPP